MMMKAGTVVLRLPAKECHGWQKTTGSLGHRDRFRVSTVLAMQFLISSFQNCETINFHVLSNPVCGILLQQPKETNSIVIFEEDSIKGLFKKNNKGILYDDVEEYTKKL